MTTSLPVELALERILDGFIETASAEAAPHHIPFLEEAVKSVRRQLMELFGRKQQEEAANRRQQGLAEELVQGPVDVDLVLQLRLLETVRQLLKKELMVLELADAKAKVRRLEASEQDNLQAHLELLERKSQLERAHKQRGAAVEPNTSSAPLSDASVADSSGPNVHRKPPPRRRRRNAPSN